MPTPFLEGISSTKACSKNWCSYFRDFLRPSRSCAEHFLAWSMLGKGFSTLAGIFISYRREDAGGYAQRLFESLASHFGKSHIFMDIDSIEAGSFAKVIRDRLAHCYVFLALIGRSWYDALTNRAAADSAISFVLRLRRPSAVRCESFLCWSVGRKCPDRKTSRRPLDRSSSTTHMKYRTDSSNSPCGN
jgi:hypothetical protein